ncbi:MAG: protein O-mannosyl-transferase family [bacterium]
MTKLKENQKKSWLEGYKNLAPAGRGLRQLERRDYLIALIPFLVALAVYRYTMLPTVFSEDCGEFVFGPYIMGVLHAPGYPMYALMGKLFSYLPFWTIAQRIIFMSSFVSAFAGYFVFLCARKFGVSEVSAIVGTLSMSFARYLWSQSVVAEVYALNLFFFCITMFFFLQWLHYQEKDYYLYAFSLLYGMSMCNHQIMGLFIPLYCLIILFVRPKFIISKTFLISLLCFAVGLSFYAYLPLRARAKPFLNWGNPYNWENFWFHVNRSVYNRDTGFSWAHIQQRIKVMWYYFDLLHNDFASVFFFFGIAGIYYAFKINRRWALINALIFFSGGLGLVFYHQSAFSENTAFVIRVFYFQSYAPFAIFVGFGLDLLYKKLKTCLKNASGKPYFTYAFNTFICLLLLIPLKVFGAYNNLSDKYLTYDFTRAVMDTMEPNAILFAEGDTVIFYLQLVEKIRPDVTVYDNFSVFYDNFLGWDFYKGVLPDLEEERLRQRNYAKTIEKDYGKRPIYFFTQQNLRYKPDFVCIPDGLIFRAVPRKEAEKTLKKQKDKWSTYHIRGIEDNENLNDRRINNLVVEYLIRQARFYLRTGKTDLAEANFERISGSESISGLTQAGLYWLNHRRPGKALTMFRKVMKIDHTITVNYYNLGLALQQVGDGELAIDNYQKFMKVWTGSPNYYANALKNIRSIQNKKLNVSDYNDLGLMFLRAGEADQAIALLEQALKQVPTNLIVFLNIGIAYEAKKEYKIAYHYLKQFYQLVTKQSKNNYLAIASQKLREVSAILKRMGIDPDSIKLNLPRVLPDEPEKKERT